MKKGIDLRIIKRYHMLLTKFMPSPMTQVGTDSQMSTPIPYPLN